MAAAAWDVLAKGANLAQVFAMLVAVLTSLLRVHYQSTRRECAELERCTRRLLRALSQWPATRPGAPLLCYSEMLGGPVTVVLADAAALVDFYKQSTLWRRLWCGGSMAAQLRDMQDVVDSYCGLLLFVNAHLLLQQQAVDHHPPIPPSSDTSTRQRRISEVNETSQSPIAQARTGCPAVTGTRDTERANDVGEGGRDTDPAGSETDMPALLPIVISHA